MSTETNVNGGTKLLTASVVMTLGVGGALLFRQDSTESQGPASARSETAANELLVRRSNGPSSASFDGLTLPRVPQQPIASTPFAPTSPAGSGGTAQFTGAIDPFRVEGAEAATQGRLTSEYGRPSPPKGGGFEVAGAPTGANATYGAPNVGMPSGGALNAATAPYAPSYLFVDPTSEAERTPLNNVSPRMELPAEYPSPRGAGSSAAIAPSGAIPGTATSQTPGLSPIGSTPSRSPNPTTLQHSPFMNAAAAPNADVSAAPRAVTPTLHAGSGTTSPAALAEQARIESARAESLRAKSTYVRRHKVRDGDTLASLAEAYYGDPARYAAIYDANRDELSNPDVLTIGTYLVIPTADEAAASTASAVANPPPAARLLPRVQIRPLGE